MAQPGIIPPWLSVSPQQFLEAYRAGTSAGLEAGQANTRAAQAQAELEARANDRDLRAWEFGQQLRENAQKTLADRELAAQQLAETTRYHTLGQELEREKLDEAEKYHQASVAARAVGDVARAEYYRARAAAAEASEKKGGPPLTMEGPGNSQIVYNPRSGVFQVVKPPAPPSLTGQLGVDRLRRTLQKDMLPQLGETLETTQARSNNAAAMLQKYEPKIPPSPTEQYQPGQLNPLPPRPVTVPPILPDTNPVPRLGLAPRPVTPTNAVKVLTKDLAREFYERAGRNKKKAEELAREAGYTF